MPPHISGHHNLDRVARYWRRLPATMFDIEAGLSVQTVAMNVQWYVSLINLLRIVPTLPTFPVTVFFLLASINLIRWICLLGMKCLVSLSDALAAWFLYNTLEVQRPLAASTEPVRLECTRPYRIPGPTTNCACDAERKLACASRIPFLPPYQLRTSPTRASVMSWVRLRHMHCRPHVIRS